MNIAVPHNAMHNILVATDFSETAAAALAQAVKLANISGGRITLLHVIYLEKIKENLLGLDALESLARALDAPAAAKPYSSTDAADRLREAAQQKLDEAIFAVAPKSPIKTVIAEGRPSLETVDYAATHGVDLIVLGTQGRGALGRALLGSVAENVLRQAQCPVMVVRK